MFRVNRIQNRPQGSKARIPKHKGLGVLLKQFLYCIVGLQIKISHIFWSIHKIKTKLRLCCILESYAGLLLFKGLFYLTRVLTFWFFTYWIVHFKNINELDYNYFVHKIIIHKTRIKSFISCEAQNNWGWKNGQSEFLRIYSLYNGCSLA